MKIKLWAVSWKPRIDGEALGDNTLNIHGTMFEFHKTREEARKALAEIKEFMLGDEFGSVNATLKLTCQHLEV